MSIDLNKIDFLILQSRYEYRLISEINKINVELLEQKFEELIFIKYNENCNYLNEDQKNNNYIKEIYNFIDYGIGFKVDNFMSAINIIRIIEDLEHCGSFNLNSIKKFKLNEISNKKVLIIDFDTESG